MDAPKKDELYFITLEWLKKRGVTPDDIAPLVHSLQLEFYDDLSLVDCKKSVDAVLHKREVQNAILTGIQLDQLTEKGLIAEPLQEMIEQDAGLYGIDEVLAMAIVNVYGSIGFTNYGYIDRVKPGILAELNNKEMGKVHTFLDDLVGAIAASAASRLAHSRQ